MCLDLTPGAGNLLGLPFWEINSAWLGESWMLNTGESPSAAVESSFVADFGGLTAPKILFEQERLLGDPAEGQGQGKRSYHHSWKQLCGFRRE